jgi:hypothetical protein
MVRMLDAPQIDKPSGELLDVATIVEGVSWLQPTGLFESYNCVLTDSKATMPCPPVVIGAPVQNASSTATTGGTLAAGTYRAVITALTSQGETTKSNEISQVTTGAASTVTFNWTAVPGASGYKVYLTNGAAGSEAIFTVAPAASTSAIISSYPGGTQAGTPPTVNTARADVAKTFTPPAWIDGITFAVYGGVTCKGPGVWGNEDALKQAFLIGESVGVERALMQQRFTNPAATDVTPSGGAVDPTVGLALLEMAAACTYAGLPTIHSPRGITTLLSRNGAVTRAGNLITSVNGSKIASGGGYGCPNNGPSGAAPAAGEMWMYASGEVVVARGDLVVQQAMDQSTNDILTLVERLYVAAVDCFVAAVRVKVA